MCKSYKKRTMIHGKITWIKNTKPDEASFRESIVNKEKGRSPDL